MLSSSRKKLYEKFELSKYSWKGNTTRPINSHLQKGTLWTQLQTYWIQSRIILKMEIFQWSLFWVLLVADKLKSIIHFLSLCHPIFIFTNIALKFDDWSDQGNNNGSISVLHSENILFGNSTTYNLSVYNFLCQQGLRVDPIILYEGSPGNEGPTFNSFLKC